MNPAAWPTRFSMPKLSGSPKLSPCYDAHGACEVGIDEAGRGPLFGRVYSAAVVLPKDDTFEHARMKDSKKFHSAKKIDEAAQYIKDNALFWAVAWCDEGDIDVMNIRQATFRAMHSAVRQVMGRSGVDILLLVDGNDFKPMTTFDSELQCQIAIPHMCFEGGDNTYSAIAAASILAKTERDRYIEDLCLKYPLLDEHYGLKSHKGYGTRRHLDAIHEHGISPWHRRSFGMCKTAIDNCEFAGVKKYSL